jgi:hypothetical protein
VADFLPDAPDGGELYAFESGAVGYLLDAQSGWATELSDKLVELLSERNKLQDSAAKN